MERDFQYLGSVVPTLIEAIECQETTSVSSHHLFEKLSDLKAFMNTEQKSRTHKEWKTMWTYILSKFEEYIHQHTLRNDSTSIEEPAFWTPNRLQSWNLP